MVTVGLDGGFDYEFVSSLPDRVVCKICHLPGRDPHLTVCCGHVFCKSCLEGMKEVKSIVNNICPLCRGEDFITFPNKQIDREVKSLQVYCTNKGRGCEYEDVVCTNRCGWIMQRRDLTKHDETECPRRKVNCQYCQLGGEHRFIEGKHKEECVEYPVPCPNECGETVRVPRKDINEHLVGCPLELINCEYQTMGCEVRITRQAKKEHNKEKMEYHLHLTKCKLDETSCELTATKSQLNETNSNLNKTATKLDEAKSKFDSSIFQLDESRKELSRAKEELSYLKSQFSHRIDALEMLLHKNSICEQVTYNGPVPDWISKLHADAEVSSRGNNVVPVTFKITGINTKKLTNREWNSNAFYTHVGGYRLRLVVSINGYGECTGTHCAMFLRLMRGRNDDYLFWPLTARVQVMLVNQIDNREHYIKTVDFGEGMCIRGATDRVVNGETAELCWGHCNFISHQIFTKATASCQFVIDDCIFVTVSML